MKNAISFFLLLMFPLSAYSTVSFSPAIRMIRSLSGPSGKVVGSKFVLDEVRSRFVYPQDSSLVVSFEFQAPKGDYILTAYWKDPQGRTFAISPDIKIQTVTKELNAYWIFMIDANKASGIWTVDIRINGEPAGSHSFELVVPASPKPAPEPEAARMPTLDELYKSIVESLVWVHKLDKAGRRTDTSSGFIIAPDSILTAFQSIDMASRLEIELASGTKISSDEIIACDRLQDWAIIKAAIGDIPPVQLGKSESAVIGELVVVLSTGPGNSRTIGEVGITGRNQVPGFGERIHINQQLPQLAVGGPLLDQYGKVIGLIGGSLAPGTPIDHRNPAFAPQISDLENYIISVTPIHLISVQPKTPPATLQSLLEWEF